MSHAEDAESVGRQVYEPIAEKYAANIEAKPHHAHYERPATLSLLPELCGLSVLDAGCGPGWYTEYLVNEGARVTAVDVTPHMLELTRARVGDRATLVQADLGKPLGFAEDAAFDLVVAPLVLHYLENWSSVFAEFRRVLKAGGLLVFSTHHPLADYQEFGRGSYFDTELVQDTWGVGKVAFYRRPLSGIIGALLERGFAIEALLEPQPTEAFRQADPEGYARLMKQPDFLVVRARCI